MKSNHKINTHIDKTFYKTNPNNKQKQIKLNKNSIIILG